MSKINETVIYRSTGLPLLHQLANCFLPKWLANPIKDGLVEGAERAVLAQEIVPEVRLEIPKIVENHEAPQSILGNSYPEPPVHQHLKQALAQSSHLAILESQHSAKPKESTLLRGVSEQALAIIHITMLQLSGLVGSKVTGSLGRHAKAKTPMLDTFCFCPKNHPLVYHLCCYLSGICSSPSSNPMDIQARINYCVKCMVIIDLHLDFLAIMSQWGQALQATLTMVDFSSGSLPSSPEMRLVLNSVKQLDLPTLTSLRHRLKKCRRDMHVSRAYLRNNTKCPQILKSLLVYVLLVMPMLCPVHSLTDTQISSSKIQMELSTSSPKIQQKLAEVQKLDRYQNLSKLQFDQTLPLNRYRTPLSTLPITPKLSQTTKKLKTNNNKKTMYSKSLEQHTLQTYRQRKMLGLESRSEESLRTNQTLTEKKMAQQFNKINLPEIYFSWASFCVGPNEIKVKVYSAKFETEKDISELETCYPCLDGGDHCVSVEKVYRCMKPEEERVSDLPLGLGNLVYAKRKGENYIIRFLMVAAVCAVISLCVQVLNLAFTVCVLLKWVAAPFRLLNKIRHSKSKLDSDDEEKVLTYKLAPGSRPGFVRDKSLKTGVLNTFLLCCLLLVPCCAASKGFCSYDDGGQRKMCTIDETGMVFDEHGNALIVENLKDYKIELEPNKTEKEPEVNKGGEDEEKEIVEYKKREWLFIDKEGNIYDKYGNKVEMSQEKDGDEYFKVLIKNDTMPFKHECNFKNNQENLRLYFNKNIFFCPLNQRCKSIEVSTLSGWTKYVQIYGTKKADGEYRRCWWNGANGEMLYGLKSVNTFRNDLGDMGFVENNKIMEGCPLYEKLRLTRKWDYEGCRHHPCGSERYICEYNNPNMEMVQEKLNATNLLYQVNMGHVFQFFVQKEQFNMYKGKVYKIEGNGPVVEIKLPWITAMLLSYAVTDTNYYNNETFLLGSSVRAQQFIMKGECYEETVMENSIVQCGQNVSLVIHPYCQYDESFYGWFVYALCLNRAFVIPLLLVLFVPVWLWCCKYIILQLRLIFTLYQWRDKLTSNRKMTEKFGKKTTYSKSMYFMADLLKCYIPVLYPVFYLLASLIFIPFQLLWFIALGIKRITPTKRYRVYLWLYPFVIAGTVVRCQDFVSEKPEVKNIKTEVIEFEQISRTSGAAQLSFIKTGDKIFKNVYFDKDTTAQQTCKIVLGKKVCTTKYVSEANLPLLSGAGFQLFMKNDDGTSTKSVDVSITEVMALCSITNRKYSTSFDMEEIRRESSCFASNGQNNPLYRKASRCTVDGWFENWGGHDFQPTNKWYTGNGQCTAALILHHHDEGKQLYPPTLLDCATPCKDDGCVAWQCRTYISAKIARVKKDWLANLFQMGRCSFSAKISVNHEGKIQEFPVQQQIGSIIFGDIKINYNINYKQRLAQNSYLMTLASFGSHTYGRVEVVHWHIPSFEQLENIINWWCAVIPYPNFAYCTWPVGRHAWVQSPSREAMSGVLDNNFERIDAKTKSYYVSQSEKLVHEEKEFTENSCDKWKKTLKFSREDLATFEVGHLDGDVKLKFSTTKESVVEEEKNNLLENMKLTVNSCEGRADLIDSSLLTFTPQNIPTGTFGYIQAEYNGVMITSRMEVLTNGAANKIKFTSHYLNATYTLVVKTEQSVRAWSFSCDVRVPSKETLERNIIGGNDNNDIGGFDFDNPLEKMKNFFAGLFGNWKMILVVVAVVIVFAIVIYCYCGVMSTWKRATGMLPRYKAE
ncbi:putative structural polyprotein [Hubei tetragnatha maxillosa virus 7]|uniref:putative structural polyprotein n=1 Tax=Hubei tetragnatha maxillosa virus 7 TaxID=1923249 RepID=UPI00090AACAB|nr:putative structural polyprotein [Hubei tetragnatha maxillosa virus 7]APG77331.1 putative structural polyprotein [Hubei tetragnatha maxillosa virus 7]